MGVMRIFPAVIALAAGLISGEWLSDIDQRFDFLTHRSIFTHGLIIPVVLYSIARGLKAIPLRLFVSGLGVGFAIHLGFDLFPRAWQGFALVHVPFVGWIPPILSWSWIAVSIVCCLYMSMRLVRTGVEGVTLPIGALALFVYTGKSEITFWGPLFSLLIGSGIALAAALWKATDAES